MYCKENIDRDAEREAIAMKKVGQKPSRTNKFNNRLRLELDYNQVELDKLFRK